ncbi:thiamine pyrophosphate-dependent enzyme [Propionicicella superfundia]|uniref:thiamine pyrophosphate-dependent enzyme n=1 Tax=Propionicicella superfundia TaxID=348582 RepID=UPI00041C90AF|nr:thiamine pyrophosphate-dependent enzyme [Propionicicella superfundia]
MTPRVRDTAEQDGLAGASASVLGGEAEPPGLRRPAPARVRTTGEALVDGLVAHDVDTVFGIPGVQTYPLFDALATSGLRLFTPRHEQTAAYMAFGYAQSTGRTGVFSVVPGPGVLNASAALLTALGTSTPLVGLTGEIPSDYVGRGLGHLHEMADQLGTARGFTKWTGAVDHPAAAPGVIADAFHAARSGRPGPVLVASPWDVLAQRASVPPCAVRAVTSPLPDAAALDAAAAALAGARNPMIMVGGGARHAADGIRRLAARLQAPVVAHRGGRGVADNDDPLGFTSAEGFERWADTDVLLAIGSRQELVWFRWPDRPDGLTVINIDIDPVQHVRLRPQIAVTADALVAVEALERLLGGTGPRASRTAEFAAVRDAVAARAAGLQPHLGHLAAIRDVLPREGYFVEEICQIGFASTFGFPVHDPRHFVTAGQQGTLGFGYPTALGVKAAHPGVPVVSVNGDGGFGFGLAELATAVQYGLGVVAIVFDNGAYGNVMADQVRIYGRPSGSTLHNPDWVALAASFGARGYRAGDPEGLRRALAEAIERDEPAVIAVSMPLDVDASPWPFLMPASRRSGERG